MTTPVKSSGVSFNDASSSSASQRFQAAKVTRLVLPPDFTPEQRQFFEEHGSAAQGRSVKAEEITLMASST
jgi:hypothetical protein